MYIGYTYCKAQTWQFACHARVGHVRDMAACVFFPFFWIIKHSSDTFGTWSGHNSCKKKKKKDWQTQYGRSPPCAGCLKNNPSPSQTKQSSLLLRLWSFLLFIIFDFSFPVLVYFHCLVYLLSILFSFVSLGTWQSIGTLRLK